MAALGARRSLGTGWLGVEVITPDAVEGDLPALPVVKLAIAAVVVDPEETKRAEQDQAVDKDVDGVARGHRDWERVADSRVSAKGKEKRADPEVRRVESVASKLAPTEAQLFASPALGASAFAEASADESAAGLAAFLAPFFLPRDLE
jgi:hypothetical protein